MRLRPRSPTWTVFIKEVDKKGRALPSGESPGALGVESSLCMVPCMMLGKDIGTTDITGSFSELTNPKVQELDGTGDPPSPALL